jgi:hypothetical protein
MRHALKLVTIALCAAFLAPAPASAGLPQTDGEDLTASRS